MESDENLPNLKQLMLIHLPLTLVVSQEQKSCKLCIMIRNIHFCNELQHELAKKVSAYKEVGKIVP